MKAILFDPIRYLTLFISLCVLSWLLFGKGNDEFFVYRFFNYFAQYIFIVLIFNAALCFFRKYTFLLLLNVLLFVVLALSIFYFSKQQPKSPFLQSTNELTVVSFSKMSRSTDYEKIAEVIDCTKFDVIAVQEIPDFDEFIQSGFYKGNCYSLHNNLVHKAVFSKYPLTDRGILGANQIVDISKDQQNVTLINVRLDKGIFDSQLQMRQADILGKKIQTIKNNLIVMGDFNSTEFNYPYQVMTDLLNDSIR